MVLDQRVAATYRYGHDGSIQQVHCVAMDLLPLVKENGGMDDSVWTSWSRPKSETVDTIYLARSDGLVQYCAIKKERDQLLPRFGGARTLSHIIDTAFAAVTCVLPHRPQDEDLRHCVAVHTLFVGGSGCYGGEYHAHPDANQLITHKNSVLPNWAPLGDSTTAAFGKP
jgi:hypothetical protein